MRGARLSVFASILALSACVHTPPPSLPPSKSAAPEGAVEPVKPDPNLKYDPAPQPRVVPQDPPGGGVIKGGEVPVRHEVPAKLLPGFEDLLKLQKEILARAPANDDEKLRLALLHATAGQFEEAERILSTIRSRSNKLVPQIDFFLRRQLGDHKEAGKLLGQFNDEDRLVTGFVIERAELVSKVRRFRDYTVAESDKVVPGGTVHLYVEPRNFALQRVQDKHILHLKYEWKLYDDRSVEQQVPAWERATVEEREDRISSNGPIAEFYQSFRLPLPANLAMGPYRVKVTVTDAHTGKNDRVFIPIYVQAVEKTR